MTRVLVTGGSGFVGANLVRRLLRDGDEVHLLLRARHDPWRLVGVRHQVRVVDADLDDTPSVAEAVRAVRPERIFHLAAYGAYPSQRDPERAARTNVLGTVALIEACAGQGFGSFVHVGTSSEYGRVDHAPLEDERAAPVSAYAATKSAATTYCEHVGRRDASRVVTVRLYTTYGPYEEPSKLFPALIVAGLDGRLPPLAHPDLAHDYVHVDDVCDALIRAAGSGPKGPATYNVASGRQTTLREVVALARDLLSITAEPAWGSFPDRPWDSTVWVGDASRIEHELGWRPRIALADGFRAMARWLAADPAILERYRAGTASAALAAEAARRV